MLKSVFNFAKIQKHSLRECCEFILLEGNLSNYIRPLGPSLRRSVFITKVKSSMILVQRPLEY